MKKRFSLQREIGPISSFVNNKSIAQYCAEKRIKREDSPHKAGCHLPLQIKVMSPSVVTRIERDTNEDKKDVKSNNGMIVSTLNIITPKKNIRFYNNQLSDDVCDTIASSSDIYSLDGDDSINTLKANMMHRLVDNMFPSSRQKKRYSISWLLMILPL